VSELTQDELKRLAVIVNDNFRIVKDPVYGEHIIISNGEKWQPDKDANQFTEVIKASKVRVTTSFNLVDKRWDIDLYVSSNGITILDSYSTYETYKAEVLRAILKAVGS
jgi:hypothetical protein